MFIIQYTLINGKIKQFLNRINHYESYLYTLMVIKLLILFNIHGLQPRMNIKNQSTLSLNIIM
jgi:hypothetical protein